MDITIIGGGPAGHAVASGCSDAGFKVLVIDNKSDVGLQDPAYERALGFGVVAHTKMVHILNPDTGDESRIVASNVIVFACGAPTEDNYFRMSGATKFGVRFTPAGQIEINDNGETNAPGIYATGDCASGETPNIVKALIQYCKSHTTREQI